ncbi:membrane protein-like protein [Methanocaldococcus villosus KIN24-T80]|uniref:Probable [NiFe]-hydrogenase-type-3 Eha complex membrane subunit A n=1 Tax=Methanocaldococcus villosus KIN24-T80 TaxID=1069083 RepID=N6V3C1_9EURY|nr:energy-converting NiFe hydrogenase A subunit EhaA [Methanocaldococcus villosus]ENN96758.1 membrane protein-like protein [Methanocaldococcus villosus KIN24-T80]
MGYILAIIVSMIFAYLFKLPLIPKSKFSFQTSIIFPTPIIALGFYVIFKYLFFDSISFSIISGIIGAVFAKYSNKIFGVCND